MRIITLLGTLFAANLLLAQSADDFVTTWKTDNPGSSNSSSITIPTTGGVYMYDVDWDNDGTFDEFGLTSDVTHDFMVAGTYTIRIQGAFPRIYFNNGGDRQKLLSVDQWGAIAWTSMENAFYGCNNLAVNATDAPDLSGVDLMVSMFRGCSSFNQSINHWDVSNIWNFRSIFQDASAFNQPLNNWDLSNASWLPRVFMGASSFNQDIGNWNTSGITNFESMFAGASSFNQDIGGWNVSNATAVFGMFDGASSFNQDIGNWNPGNSSSFQYMFRNAVNFNQNIGNWDVSAGETMYGMFEGATSFNQDIGGWNTSSAYQMYNMFKDASSFDQDIGGWYVGGVTNFSGMFSGAGLSTANYDALLIGWSQQNLQSGRVFSAGSSQYCAGAFARQSIITNKGWTIRDGGPCTQPPVALCQNVSVDADINCQATVTAEEVDNGSYDPEGAPLNYSLSPQGPFITGNTLVTLTVTDNFGFTGTCTATITVTEDILPEIICPADIQVVKVNGECSAIVTYNAPVGTDNCPGAGTVLVSGPGSGGEFPVGATTETYMVTDASGNSATCSFTVTVSETVAPQISCPANSTINNDTDQCSAVVNFSTPAGTDNCAGATTLQTAGISSGGTFPVGTTVNTFVVTDVSGNTASCSFTVTVNDTQNPTITCPGNWHFTTDFAPWCGTGWEYGPPPVSDNCPNTTLDFVSGRGPYGIFPLGITTEVWKATDASGNTTICSWTVTVTDNKPPFMQCKNATVELNINGNASISSNQVNDGSWDNCGIQSLAVSPNTFTTADLGSSTVTLTGTDNYGNTKTCTATVKVLPNPTKTFNTEWQTTNANESITINTTGGGYDYFVDWGDGTVNTHNTGDVSHTYASAGTYKIRIFGDFPRASFGNQGYTRLKKVLQWGEIAWASMQGTFANCEYLTVPATDAPDLSGVNSTANMFYGCYRLTGSGQGSFNNWDVSNVTNMNGMFYECFDFNEAIGNWNVSNVTNMNNMFTRAKAFNQNIANWNVSNVTGMFEMFMQAISFNQNISNWNVSNVSNMGGMFFSALNFNQNIGNWNVGNVTNMAEMFFDATAFNQAIGNWNVSKVTNMTRMFFQAIAFNQNIGNWNVSNVSTMMDMFLYAGLSTANYDALLNGWSSLPSLKPGVPFHAGSSKYCQGGAGRCDLINNHGWSINDLGKAQGCNSFLLNCPANIVTVNDPNSCYAVVNYTVTYGENCAGETLSQIGGIPSGGDFGVGVTTNVFLVTDTNGNTSVCGFTVAVNEANPPIIVCPADISVGTDNNQCSAAVDFSAPVGTDICSAVTTVQTTGLTSGDVFPAGATINTFVATDAAGNTTSCSFTVTVSDTEAPEISCPADITLTSAPGTCGKFYNYAIGTSDNCGSANWTKTAGLYPGIFPVGLTVNTFVATDGSGNTATCSFSVTVNDIENPTIICPADISIGNDAGVCSAVVDYATPASTDNCSVSGTSQAGGLTSGATFPVGTTVNTFVVTDVSGNTSSCSFSVTVVDIEPPTAVCQNVTVHLDITGNGSTTAAAVNNGSNDICGIASLNLNQTSFNCFQTGNNTVILTVEDMNANTSTCSATVTVVNSNVCNLLSKEIVNTSEAGSPETGDGSMGNERAVLIGETVTFRLLLKVPEGSGDNVVIKDLLPDGLQYVNGSAQFIESSDNGLSYSTTISGGGSSGDDVYFHLGSVVNNDNDLNDETLEITFNALVLNVAGNQAGILLQNEAELSEGGSVLTTSEKRTVEVAEPQLGVEIFQRDDFNGNSISQGDAGDRYVYTVRISNTGNAPAYNVQMEDIIPSQFVAQYGVFITTGSNFSGTNYNVGTGLWNASWTVIQPGVNVSITIRLELKNTVRPLDSWTNTATVTYNSLPVAGPQNRNGADGFGGALNDYEASANSPSFKVPEPEVAKQVEHPSQSPASGIFGASYTDTSSDPNTNTGQYTADVDAAIGELFSYIITVTFPEGTTADFTMIDLTSPNGHTSGRQYRVMDMLSAEVIHVGANLSGNGIEPVNTFFTIEDSSPSDGDGTRTQLWLGGGRDVLNTPDNVVNDNDRYIIRINARMDDEDDSGGPADNVPAPVSNRAGDETGNRLQYQWRDASNSQYTRNIVADVEIVEPDILLTKSIVATNGNGIISGGNLEDALPGDQLTFSFSLTNNGSAAAYNVILTDNLPSVFDLTSVSINSGTDNSDLANDQVNVSVASIPVGGSFTVTAMATIRVSASPGLTYINTANASYKSQPGSGLDIRSYSRSDQASVNIADCLLTISEVTVTDEVCPGAEDGTISITASSSTNNTLTYSLTGPESATNGTGLFTGLMAGTYALTVSDNGFPGCTATQTNIQIDAGVDNTPPSISCSSNITVNNDEGQCNAVVNFTAPTGTDNCPGAMTEQVAGQASGSAFPVGSTVNTYVVTDASGNTASCSLSVTVSDTEAPVISCPADITLTNAPGTCGKFSNYAISTADNCGSANWTKTAGLYPGIFPVGITVNTFVATDGSGNTATCSFSVTVNDIENPTIICPANISVNTNAGICGSVVNYDISTSDNCTANWEQTGGLASGSTFPVGQTANNFLATDATGNIATCTFTVNVIDNQKPTLTCPENIEVTTQANECSAKVCYPDPIVTDNCPPATPSGYTYKTSYGNSHYYQANALSNFTTAYNNAIAAGGHLASITSEEEKNVIAESGAGYAWIGGNDEETEGVWKWNNCETFSYSNWCSGEPNGGSENNYLELEVGGCFNDLNHNLNRYAILEIEGVKLQRTSGLAQNDLFPLGVTNIKYKATDNSGNTSTCSFKVTVLAESCGQPIQVYHKDTTTNSAKIKWNSGTPCNTNYQLRIRYEISAGVWSGWSAWGNKSGPGNEHAFTSLSAGTFYQYQIRSKCGTTNSNIINGWFHTLPQNSIKQNKGTNRPYSKIDVLMNDQNPEIEQTFVSVKAVPNPATEYVSLFLEGFEQTQKEIHMFDLFGKLIFNAQLPASENNPTIDLTRFNIKPGVHMIRVSNGTTQKTIQLMIGS
ncbi:MAG: BspA family leucine-rich repeat surface protein [Saprospiraceae bacterium]|nr:BspA family leucine-rich repeat surface protein [Saprospiraceae bacterium]